ncbi:MAG: EF-P lysine aminoacylase GenX [Planctomycetaceae bacterium]|nr:EF-P lysine aminoacylase GenX [Planctomycetaceae bacterium]
MDFHPTATLQTLKARAQLLEVVREYFREHDYWEVETPMLSEDIVVDAHLDPYIVDDGAFRRFLQTSPEFHMKRLLAVGAEAIFQVTHAFRQRELGTLHNPEFTIVEWYRLGDTYHDQMKFTQGLVTRVFEAAKRIRGTRESMSDVSELFSKITYDEAFKAHTGSHVIRCSPEELVLKAERHQVSIPDTQNRDDRDGLLNLLLSELVEPHLGKSEPTFLLDYPASQAALARIRRDDYPPVAERFELYIRGIEICNGYQELTDPDELTNRIEEQLAIRQAEGADQLPSESRLLAAMRAGLPECSGVALGFDRLVMLALGCERLSDVLAFPFDRA